MKRVLIILILLSAAANLFAPGGGLIPVPAPDPVNPFQELWSATCFVESTCKADTVNATEQAYGIAQIRQIRIDDYNLRTGGHYSLYDCLDSATARKIYMYYAGKYGPMDLETIARAWNGSGPMTEDYWNKIKMELDVRHCNRY